MVCLCLYGFPVETSSHKNKGTHARETGGTKLDARKVNKVLEMCEIRTT